MQDAPKLGFFIQPVHPPSRRYVDVLREDREAVVLADRLGYRMRTKLARFGALDLMRDRPGQPDSELSPRRCLERLVIAGTPERVVDRILALRSEVGAFGSLLYTGHDWTDPALARRSMELMADRVWPRLEAAARGTGPA